MQARPVIVAERLLDDLHALARIGAAPAGGVTRRAYSAEHQQASQWLVNRMSEAGLTAHIDAVGNVIGRLGPSRGGAVMCGSHIDTVPEGGWLDGAYGVLAALECARALQDADVTLGCPFEVAAFVDEEGAYLSLLGSRAVVGAISLAEITAASDIAGRPLTEAMSDAGLDGTRFARAARDVRDVSAYVELHIEQGPLLEQQRIDVGIVEGIVGILGIEHQFTGSADHAGTTPIEMRRDALRCAAELITAAYARLASRRDGRFAFGAIEVLPGASNVVPRTARLIQEIRALDEASIEAIFAACNDIAREVAGRLHVDHQARRVSFNAPARMAPKVMKLIEASCVEAGVSHVRMPSGAGHDAQSFAAWCPSGMIFVPSRHGASHRADENTDERDLAIGADILLRTVQKLAA